MVTVFHAGLYIRVVLVLPTYVQTDALGQRHHETGIEYVAILSAGA